VGAFGHARDRAARADIDVVSIAAGQERSSPRSRAATPGRQPRRRAAAGGRWTESRRAVLRASRIDTTGQLVSAMEAASPRPRVLVSGSAVGYYGDRGDEPLRDVGAS